MHVRGVDGRWIKDHGLYGQEYYSTWNNVNDRCYDSSNPAYVNYGGRGIHNHWKEDVQGFVDYLNTVLGPRPSGHSLDRIDNDKGYEPGNLRWASRRKQSVNRRKKKGSKSSIPGVRWCQFHRKWIATISIAVGRRKHVGYFDVEEDAIRARKMAEETYYGNME